jgi:Family of unknown function (DUF6220)
MRSTYRVLAGLIALCVVLQASFIAGGWFGAIKDMDDGAVFDKNSEGNIGHGLHAIFGMNVIPLLAIALLIVSFFAKVPGGVKWAAIVFGVVALQFMLAFIAFSVPVIGALHGANAIVLLGVAGYASRRGGRAAPAPASTEAPTAGAQL